MEKTVERTILNKMFKTRINVNAKKQLTITWLARLLLISDGFVVSVSGNIFLVKAVDRYGQ